MKLRRWVNLIAMEMTMTKLHFAAATAAILVAMSGPSFAAKKPQKQASPAYSRAQSNASDARMFSGAYGSYASQPVNGRTGNLPYPDRPYGDPGRW